MKPEIESDMQQPVELTEVELELINGGGEQDQKAFATGVGTAAVAPFAMMGSAFSKGK